MTFTREAWLVAAAAADNEGPASAPDVERSGRHLVARAAEGDEVALAALYERHAPPIHRFLYDLLGDTNAAADATQETFARAFRRLGALDDPDRLAPWLFGIARNVSLERRKARRRYARVVDDHHELGDDDHPPDDRTPEAVLLGYEAARLVREALEAMPEARRAALLLRVDHGLAYEDIAKLMRWSIAKVKIEIFRGRRTLRELLMCDEGTKR